MCNSHSYNREFPCKSFHIIYLQQSFWLYGTMPLDLIEVMMNAVSLCLYVLPSLSHLCSLFLLLTFLSLLSSLSSFSVSSRYKCIYCFSLPSILSSCKRIHLFILRNQLSPTLSLYLAEVDHTLWIK